MQMIYYEDAAGKEGRKRLLGVSPDAKCSKVVRRSPSSASAEPGNSSSDNECSDIAEGVERILSGVPVHPSAECTAPELGDFASRRSDIVEPSATYNAGHDRLAPIRCPADDWSDTALRCEVAKGRSPPDPLDNGANAACRRGSMLSAAGAVTGCERTSTSCGQSSPKKVGTAALAGFGKDVLKLEYVRLCKEEESIKAALKQVRLGYTAARRAVVACPSASASPAQAPAQFAACSVPPATRPAEPIHGKEQQRLQQQRLQQLMPPPPAPALQLAAGAYRPAAGAYAPRLRAGSQPTAVPPPYLQPRPQQSAPPLMYSGAPAPCGVTGFDRQQGGQRQSLPPRMKVSKQSCVAFCFGSCPRSAE